MIFLKKRFSGLVVTVVSLCLLGFFVSYFDNGKKTEDNEIYENTEDKIRINDTKPSFTSGEVTKETERYMVIIENSELCTYKVSNGKKALLRKSRLEPLLIPDDDIKKLEDGIYSDNLEDIYFYYEAYAS